MAEGLTVAAAAERCGVHPTTSFRWRHRFLRAETADRERLSGIVEADETFFRLSFKGSRRWRGDTAPPGRGAKSRGAKAALPGSSIEQVPFVVARGRAGATRAVVLPDRSADALDAAIGATLPVDGVLCSDAEPAMANVVAGTAFATSRSTSRRASGSYPSGEGRPALSVGFQAARVCAGDCQFQGMRSSRRLAG